MQRKLSYLSLVFLLAAAVCAAQDDASRYNDPTAVPPLSPARLALLPGGGYVVSDGKAHTLVIFDAQGNAVRRIPIAGKPLGIGVDARQRMFVGNAGTHHVEIYTLDGTMVGALGSADNPAVVNQPNAIAFAEDRGLIFVADGSDHTVKVFDLGSGEFRYTFGSLGTAEGQFNYPTGVAYDPKSGSVLVSDFYNSRVQILDVHGAWIATVKKTTDPPLVRPQGLDVDQAGNIYVADSLWAGVYVFNSAGASQQILGQYGTGDRQLRTPLDVKVTPCRLLVADFNNNRVNSSFGNSTPNCTPPVLIAQVSPSPNPAGWNNSDATVTLKAAETSGAVQKITYALTGAQTGGASVNGPTASFVISAEGSTIASFQGWNDVGSSDPGQLAVRLDRTPPQVSVLGVKDGSSYLLGTNLSPSCSTSDAVSGVATPAALSVVSPPAAVGALTATCSGATDLAGNLAAPVTANYSVVYGFSGFMPPLNQTGRTFHRGVTIPVRWQLTRIDGFISDLTAIRSIQVASNRNCSGAPDGAPVAATGKALRYDPEANQFVFGWETNRLRPGCYNLLLNLKDSTTKTVIVSLR